MRTMLLISIACLTIGCVGPKAAPGWPAGEARPINPQSPVLKRDE